MMQIVSYYENYKNNKIPNDDLIAIISNLEIMVSIETIDNMIINQYGDNIIDRLDFYNQIYHHHIFDIIIKELEHKENKNHFIFAMIFVELHKCNLTNHIIDILVTEELRETLIKQKNKYSKMITKLVELAVKEKEIYNDIINLIEENKHIYYINN